MRLVRWGYPYVFDRFRFRMTRTRSRRSSAQVRQELDTVFAPCSSTIKGRIVGQPTNEILCLVGRQHALVGGNRRDATLRSRLNSAFRRPFLMNSTVSIVQSCDSVKRRAAPLSRDIRAVVQIRVRSLPALGATCGRSVRNVVSRRCARHYESRVSF
ncbi:DUF1045 domain-containing protein [Bradyrhizobium sp. CSS354]|uniref:DUF1045 domain-containing protein n=1 Tax=Bradyrhizobium sp. CSS354 TaxID=2699172 RepID=UPI0023C5D118|nr:DUF1045 domain-containing protein [Bradyrhizobium sp. CSS354]